MSSKQLSNIHDSYSSHFRFGFRDDNQSKNSKNLQSFSRSHSEKSIQHLFNNSSVKLGTNKFEPNSLAKSSFTPKESKRCRSAYNKTQTNCHNFSLGFRPAAYPVQAKPELGEKADYLNINDRTNWNFGPFKTDLKTTFASHFKGQKMENENQIKLSKHMTWESSLYLKPDKLEYQTTSMDYKGGRVSRRKVLKVPDSSFFPIETSKQHNVKNSSIDVKFKECVQEPTISNQFIYSQHYSLGNQPFQVQHKKEEPGFSKDSVSAWINREKVLGSEIELGLGKNYYKTDYKQNFVRRFGAPPDTVKNNMSFVKFGNDKRDSYTEYDSEFKKQPFCQAIMLPPKNEKQNIKIC